MRTKYVVFNEKEFEDFLEGIMFFKNELDELDLIMVNIPWADQIIKYFVVNGEIQFSKTRRFD